MGGFLSQSVRFLPLGLGSPLTRNTPGGRLFTRYGNPLLLSPNLSTLSTTKTQKEVYGPFAERFIASFAPEIMKAYFVLVEREVGGEWVPMKVCSHLLSFFEDWFALIPLYFFLELMW
jgi:hypothetical protein